MVVHLRNARFPFFAPFSLSIAPSQSWAVTGPARTKLLEVLAGEHTPDPPTARTYAWGHEFWPSQVVARVEFGTGAQSQAPYLGARFESYIDEFDYSLRQSLLQIAPPERVQHVLETLKLEDIADRWVVALSNGQSRRAQIAHALVRDPRLLLVNDPFLGVDPENRRLLDQLLQNLEVPVILGLCDSQPMPSWITNVAHASDRVDTVNAHEYTPRLRESSLRPPREFGEAVLEIRDLDARIRSKPVFQGLDLKVRRGERIFLKGANGSGKSTLMAIITADHPQGWSADISMFGQKREAGVDSYFSINSEIGASSPELHAIFPRHLNARDAIATGFRNDFMRRRDLDNNESARVDELLGQIGIKNELFGVLNKQDQKLVLLARALVKNPGLLLLDEAFSTFDDRALDLAFKMLDGYEGAVVVTGHHEREIPPCDGEVGLRPQQQ